mgnify:CR=1 FL=1
MSSGGLDDPDGPIEAYLDRLLTDLTPGRPRAIRRLLAETEAHLRDAAAEGVAHGLSPMEAEQEAVRRFGPSPVIARAERRRGRVPLVVTLRQCVSSGLLLGAIGAIAVGISGGLAAVLRAVGGNRFIIDVPPGQTLAAADCARWLSIAPNAHSCQQAAVMDWANETVYYRLGVGVLGVAALAVFVLLRRRWRRAGRWVVLPSSVVDTIAATLFGLAGVWLLGLGIDDVIVASGHGAGQWLSAAPVALVAGGFFAARLVGDVRRGPDPRAGDPRAGLPGAAQVA